MKITFMGFLALLLVSNVALPQATNSRVWAPLDLPIFDPSPKPTKPKEMVSSLQVNGFPIVLEETDLEAVRDHFGAAVGHQGDAGESFRWLCLTGQSSGQRLALWMESGEIDGGKVGGFQVRQIDENLKLDPRCRQVTIPIAVLTLPKAVHVGMTEADLLKALGEPTARKRDALFFGHEHKLVIRHEPYDSENDVVVLLRKGRVSAVQVWKTTSS